MPKQISEEVKEKLKAAESAIEQIKSRFGDGAIMKFGESKIMQGQRQGGSSPAALPPGNATLYSNFWRYNKKNACIGKCRRWRETCGIVVL